MDPIKIKKTKVLSWIYRCRKSLIDFKNNNNNMTMEEKIKFTRRQYYLLYMIGNILSGKTKLEGVSRENFK